MAQETTETLLRERLNMADGALFRDRKGRVVELPRAWAPLADTHGHLTYARGHDPAAVLVRAALAGVRLLVIPLDPTDDAHDAPACLRWLDETVEEAASLLEQARRAGLEPPEVPGDPEAPGLLDRVRIMVGVHPYGAADFLGRGERGEAFGAASHEALQALLASPRCVGVGEIGLDFGPYSKLGQEVQLEAFEEQLLLAHERALPVELHLRDEEDGEHESGHDLALEVLRTQGVPAAGCDLHCYTAGPRTMRPFVELGCHVAFGGAVSFARSHDIRAAAAACPAHLILSETDSPYMAPVPLRGMRSEPAMVAFSAACVAQVRADAGVDTPEETYAALWRNARAFLRL